MRLSVVFQRTLFAAFLVCAILLVGCERWPIEDKHVNVVFRLDDYSARSSTDMELRIIDVFRKNGASITFGVIPFVHAGNGHDPSPQNLLPLTPKKGEILRNGFKDGVLDIALHGYSHQTISTKRMTEFSGLDYNAQVERLTKGKNLLEAIINAPVTTFAPPWSQYDRNTVRALERAGFSTLSADRRGEVPEDSKLNFLPATCEPWRLRDAIEAARISSYDQPLIVVLLHEYNFREINASGPITFQEFYDLLSWLKSQRDVRLVSISQATKVIKDLSANRVFMTRRNHSLNRSLNEFLPVSFQQSKSSSQLSNCLYAEPTRFSRTLIVVVGFYLMIFTLGAIFSFALGYIVFQRPESIAKICTVGGIVLSVMMLIYIFHDLHVYLVGMEVSAAVIGASIGLCICFQYLKTRRGVASAIAKATREIKPS